MVLALPQRYVATAVALAIWAVAASMPVSSYAAPILLDFGNTVQYDANNASPHTLYFDDVATGIDATLVADGPWNAFKSTYPCVYVAGPNDGNPCPGGAGQLGLAATSLQWPHGSVAGDARVFVDAEIPYQSIGFTLSLWEAGTSYTTPYDPGVSYEWTLAFYDIDSSPGVNWDEVTLLTPGTYEVTATTALTVDASVPGQVNFSGLGAGDVPGMGGLASPITQAQADVMVLYNLTNRNSVEFIYTVGLDASWTGSLTGRNFLIDGGSLAFATCSDGEGGDCGFDPPQYIPEPTALALIGLGLVSMGFFRNKSRCSAHRLA